MRGAERRDQPRVRAPRPVLASSPRVQAACIHVGWGGGLGVRAATFPRREAMPGRGGGCRDGAPRGEHRLLVDTRDWVIWRLPLDTYAAGVPAD